MPKKPRSEKKTATEIWIALIGLIGVVITGLLASPILLEILKRPTPTSVIAPPDATEMVPVATATKSISTDCVPASVSELPPQAVAIVEPLEGSGTRVPLSSLRYEEQSGLWLASGIFVEFNRMMSFELTNPDFLDHFNADVTITFLDCKVYKDMIQSRSGSFLTGESAVGELELHILKVKSVHFQW